MGSGLEEYWDGVDGPAERQVRQRDGETAAVSSDRSCEFSFSPLGLIIFPRVSQPRQE